MMFRPAASLLCALLFIACGGGEPDPSPDAGTGGGGGGGGGGSGGIRVTTLPVQPGVRALSPRFSPDSQRLAYLRSGSDTHEVAVMAADGTNSETLASNASYLTGFAWKADGSALYYSGIDLHEVAAAGGTPQKIADAFASMQLDLNPDGTRLIYTVNGSQSLMQVDLSTDPATTTSLMQKGQSPRFSPDGTRLAFHEEGIFKVLELSTGVITEIGDGAHFFSSLDWFSDGQRLILTTEENIELVALDVSPPTRRRLESGFAVMDVDLSPDDRKIAYAINGQAALRVLTGF